MENSNATLVTEETAFNDLFTYIQQRVRLTDSDKAFIRQRFISGTMRVFYIDGKAQEQALEDTWVLAFTHDGIDEIFEHIPQMERLLRMMAQRTLAVLQKRLFLTVSSSAEERYMALIERHPSIEQLVPQHQIASYLGILPESLSRMKKQRIQKTRAQHGK